MRSYGAAQSAYEPEKYTSRATPTLATRIAQQKYFRQINEWSRSKNAMPLNTPESAPFAHHNSTAPARAQIALLKTHFQEPGAKLADPIANDQATAALLARMDERERRKGYVGETIGKKLVELITQTKDADTLDALRQALCSNELRNDPAVQYAFPFGVPFPLGLQDVERATERFSSPSEDLSAERGINYVLSDNFLKKLNDMPENTISIGKHTLSKPVVIEAIKAVRSDSELKKSGPEMQELGLTFTLATTMIDGEFKPKSPQVTIDAVNHLRPSTKQEVKNGTADMGQIAEEVSDNFCGTTGDTAACKAATKEQFGLDNLNGINKWVKSQNAPDAAKPDVSSPATAPQPTQAPHP
jgi:hypothetical protein